jgi:hypothetical protein
MYKMRHMEGLKNAAELIGLTEWELRTGALSGKYPMMRIGGAHGRMIFDIDLLNERIGELMQENIQEEVETHTLMRPVQIRR